MKEKAFPGIVLRRYIGMVTDPVTGIQSDVWEFTGDEAKIEEITDEAEAKLGARIYKNGALKGTDLEKLINSGEPNN